MSSILFVLLACHGPDVRHPGDDSAPSIASCAEGEVLDGDTCVPEVCGVGTWGNLPVDGNTVYVDVAAAVDGDGSESAPLTSIQAGADLAGDRGGGLVAVAAGTYVEVVAMDSGHDGVTLAGRCRELVTIDGSEGGKDDPAIAIIGGRKEPEIGVEGVTVTGGRYSGVWAEAATLSMSRCDFRQNAIMGLFALGADVALTDVGVYETGTDERGRYGRGIGIESGARLTATNCTIQGNAEVGVFSANASGFGTETSLDDTDVLDTVGTGIEVTDGAALTASGCTVQGNAEFGVLALDADTTVDLVDTSILDTSAAEGGGNGDGVWAQDGAAVTATGCTIQGNNEWGVFAGNHDADAPTTTVVLVDSRVLDTHPRGDGSAGDGIMVLSGATLTATGCVVQGNAEAGVFASDEGGGGVAVDLSSTEILDTLQSAEGHSGRGLDVQLGAVLRASLCTIEGNAEVGVVAHDEGTTVDLVDSAIRGTRRGRTTGFALGLAAQRGGLLTATGTEVSGTEGPGVYAVSGGRVELDGGVLSGNGFAAAVVLDGSLVLDGTTLADTTPDDEHGGGFGVFASSVFGSPTLRLSDSTIGPHEYAAVWLDGAGSYDIERNVLSGSAGVDDHGTIIHGNAIFAESGVTAWNEATATGLLLAENTFSDASEIGVLLHDASAMLTGNSWSGNGTDLRQQLCDGPDHVHGDVTSEDGTVTNDDATPLTTEDLAGIPSTVVCPTANVLISSIMFTSLYLPETETAE